MRLTTKDDVIYCLDCLFLLVLRVVLHLRYCIFVHVTTTTSERVGKKNRMS